MQLDPIELHLLFDYEQVDGLFSELYKKDGRLIASIGRYKVGLPLDMEHQLRPLVGQRLTILKTDIPNKQYLFRILKNESTEVKTTI